MYFAVNTPHHIATLGGVIVLTASTTINQILKFMGSPTHLQMRLHGPYILSLLIFWQPLTPLTSLYASICPYLKHQQVGYAQIILILVTDNSSLGVMLHLIP